MLHSFIRPTLFCVVSPCNCSMRPVFCFVPVTAASDPYSCVIHRVRLCVQCTGVADLARAVTALPLFRVHFTGASSHSPCPLLYAVHQRLRPVQV